MARSTVPPSAPDPRPDRWSPPRPDPRLADPEVAAWVAGRARATRGYLPLHLAGAATARSRARRGGPGPVDDEQLLVRDLVVRGAAGPLPARCYRPRTGARATVLFLHGGGWVTGDLDTDDPTCRRLAAAAGAAVLSLGYRLAPEHPFPAGLEDAAAVLCRLADGDPAGALGELGLPAAPLAVAGAGAGGQLAALLALRSRAGDVPALAHQLLLCPVLDCDLDRPSHREHEDLGPSVADLAWFWGAYVPDRAARRSPRVSPLRAPQLAGLPPTAVVVAGADPLRDEAVEFCARLQQAGVPVRRVLVEGVPHAFLEEPALAGAQLAVRAAAEHLAASLDAAAAGGRVLDLTGGRAGERTGERAGERTGGVVVDLRERARRP
ncbi:alpha/beta hydrolase [Kineococcus sp. SYSU DK006]|uniref:alpha/beta hydrolase n=1 Tax=Kineococcus sp. SYSU DK006 TaxID=3383127 RepID=UPI003D7CEDFD